jgi:prepilin-type N-terminal cleavage/methylation domain-containing protein
MQKKGFTLIELLIVVAIIGILAAIAIPNFLNAQVRAKVAKVQSEMRTLATGLESYMVDHNEYIFDVCSSGWPWYITDVISTPINYISSGSLLIDPFRVAPESWYPRGFRYRFVNIDAHFPTEWPASPLPGDYPGNWSSWGGDEDVFKELWGTWRISSSGPDNTASAGFGGDLLMYDPTNGTISDGDVVRSMKKAAGK